MFNLRRNVPFSIKIYALNARRRICLSVWKKFIFYGEVICLEGKVVRVKSWEDFKNLIMKYAADTIAYNIEQGVPARHLTSLRLILPIRKVQYVFIDTAAGEHLRKTGIKLHKDNLGNIYIRDEDVIKFLKSELKIKNLKAFILVNVKILEPFFSSEGSTQICRSVCRRRIYL